MKGVWTAGAAIGATFRLLFCCPRCGKIIWSQRRTTPQHCPCRETKTVEKNILQLTLFEETF